MAFPWIFAENFELGTIGAFDSETDTVTQLDIAHYKTLARYPWKSCAPYSGAYCMRLQLTGGTADAFVAEADVDIADTATAFFKFEIWFSPTFTGTANDIFTILELRGAAAAVTGSVGVQVTAATNLIQLGVGSAASAAAPTAFATEAIERGIWYTVEAKFVIQTGGTGTADLYLTRSGRTASAASQASVATATNIAVTDGVLGIQDHLATTTGVILIDGFVMDDARIYPQPRYQIDQVHTQSGHAFVGPGWIAGAAILKGTSPVMTLFDTDAAEVTSSQSYSVYFDSSNQTSIGGRIFFKKGCYVQLSGTNPIGQVLLVRTDFTPGVFGPRYFSDAGVKALGLAV